MRVIVAVNLTVTAWEVDDDTPFLDPDGPIHVDDVGPVPAHAKMGTYVGTPPIGIGEFEIEPASVWQPAIHNVHIWTVLEMVGATFGVGRERAEELLRFGGREGEGMNEEEANFLDLANALATLMDMARMDGGMGDDLGGEARDAYRRFQKMWVGPEGQGVGTVWDTEPYDPGVGLEPEPVNSLRQVLGALDLLLSNGASKLPEAELRELTEARATCRGLFTYYLEGETW